MMQGTSKSSKTLAAAAAAVAGPCRHTGRFLVLWLTCLPFVIWQELGWFSVPISMVVSFLLFGIEEIGVQIEEPFGILALEVG